MIWTGAAAGFVHDHHHLINDGGESNRNGFLEVTDTVKTPSEIGGPPGLCFSRSARFTGQSSFLCRRMWYVINHGFSIQCAELYLSPIPILRGTRVQGNAFFSNFQASQPFLACSMWILCKSHGRRYTTRCSKGICLWRDTRRLWPRIRM